MEKIFILSILFFLAGCAHKPAIKPATGVAEPVDFVFNSPASIKDWRERSFHGKTQFEIKKEPKTGENALRAYSKSASSALFKEMDIDISKRPILVWEWKVLKFPTGKKNQALAAKKDNDYGARVYAVFKGDMPFQQDIIQYVWDDHFKEGEHADSPFLKKVKIFVAKNGPLDPSGKWIFERRDLAKDYRTLFGKKPERNLVVIGMTSDSDNTKSESEAYFRRIAIEFPKK